MKSKEIQTVRLIGVDLGQQQDYTAISVTERAYVPTGERFDGTYRRKGRQVLASLEKVALEYRVRHLERPSLGTPYTEVVDRILELIKALGGNPALVVDATGVGRPVMDMLWRELIKGLEGTTITVTPCTVTITGGNSVTRNPDLGGHNVPKRDLISAALVLMQNGRLKIAEGLSLKETLVKELLNFRVKINISTAHDSYEAWREGDHDDLVLSVALACWAGERFLEKVDSVPVGPPALVLGP
jgi:hypothetical protein